jgi:hypothetical protein
VLVFLAALCAAGFVAVPAAKAGDSPAKVYVVLWFDTEDYILPASDDAALRVADFLSREKVRATFKVVGEKARTLERRGRTDVIDALKKHEIGFHSNFHSVQPSPAMYLSNLGWDEGVAEFDRRERPGFEDVKRIFGAAPSCYGQPGSSWGPQSYGAMRKWGMKVYLDAGSHVRLDDKPCYYCGILNLYKLAHQLRASLEEPKKLEEAEQQFLAARAKLLADKGGVISIFYHPCEFVHKQFWDGVNFLHGANPPRERWQLPPAKTPEQSKAAYEVFENYIRFMKRFPDVQFITASDAAKLYHDKAHEMKFTPADIRMIAVAVRGIAVKGTTDVHCQQYADFALASSEVFALLNNYVAERVSGRSPEALSLDTTPYGPSNWVAPLTEGVTTDGNQFGRTALDVADFLKKQGRIPTAVWLGSLAVPPEAYLGALADVAVDLVDGKPMPETVKVRPAKFTAADYVAEDGPELWGWVIFPRGFRAPAMMELAKRQAWTVKSALLDRHPD